MRKLLNYTFIIALMIGLVACGSSNSPEGVVKNFYAALAKNDIEAAMKLIDFPSAKEADLAKEKEKVKFVFGMMAEEAEKAGVNLADIQIGKVVYAEDKKTARVEVIMTGKEGKKETAKVPVVDREGTWKVLLK